MKYPLIALTVAAFAASVAGQDATRIYTRPEVPPREALERLNLRMAWRVYLPSMGRRDGIHSVLLLEDQVLVCTRYGTTLSLDPQTGATQWQRQVGRAWSVTRPLEADADWVYLVNYGYRYSLRRKTGEPAPGGPVPMEHGGLVTVGEGLQTWHDDFVYTVRIDRSLTAEHVNLGYLLWRFALPARVMRSPDVTNADVFVAPEGAGLMRIDRPSGQLVWTSPEAHRFLATNPKFTYAVDRQGRLLVLDYERGTRLSTLDTRDFVVPLNNERTDRVFLAAHNGLLVCLHDREYATPVHNRGAADPKQIFKRRPDLEDPGPGVIPEKVRGKEDDTPPTKKDAFEPKK